MSDRALNLLGRNAVKPCLGLLLACLSTASLAADIQSLAAIKSAVSDYVDAAFKPGDDVDYTVGRLDPCLRLPACAAPLTANAPNTGRGYGKLSVEVRCEGDQPWALYVSVTIAKYGMVAVAKRAIHRGAALGENDFQLERRPLDAGERNGVAQKADILGMAARRPLGSGELIPLAALQRARLVRRGEKVTLMTENALVSVRMRGKALEDGVAGELIEVRAASSQRVVEGVVVARGVVIVRGNSAVARRAAPRGPWRTIDAKLRRPSQISRAG